ncbi:MAG: hypothetical protein KC547_06990 [Anaerolineae bacterium]|nr:hypothetical protein [Anaerolineae bacterium]MCA9908473.1 hypothetical protein [Anaerolineae bacterium]
MMNLDPDTVIRNIDPVQRTFLTDKLNTLVKWDVLRFFHHNPLSAHTAGQIAAALGRDLESVAGAAAGLAETGLLQVQRRPNTTIYLLTDDADARKEIDTFMRACDNARFRRYAIAYVLNFSTARN